MIYLIGGAHRVGKSLIARSVAENQKAELISTDEVCENYAKQLSDKEREERFPLPGFSGSASENTLKPEEWVNLQIISAKSLENELSQLISEAFLADKTIVIEGVHLLPEYVQGILAKYGSDKIHVLYVGLTNVEQAIEGIVKNTNPNNWLKQSNPEVIRQVAETVAAFSVRIKDDAIKYQLPYKERTQDFESDITNFSKQLYEFS